jgi:phosphopantothenate synthetase
MADNMSIGICAYLPYMGEISYGHGEMFIYLIGKKTQNKNSLVTP